MASTLIPSELQVQADVSRTGRVTPIPSPIINITLPGNSVSYSDRLRERLYSPLKTPPHKKHKPSQLHFSISTTVAFAVGILGIGR